MNVKHVCGIRQLAASKISFENLISGILVVVCHLHWIYKFSSDLRKRFSNLLLVPGCWCVIVALLPFFAFFFLFLDPCYQVIWQ